MSIEEFRENQDVIFAIPLSQSAPQVAQGVATVEAKSAFNMASAPMPESLNAKLGPAIMFTDPALMERSNNAGTTLQQPPQGMKLPENDVAYFGNKMGEVAAELFNAFSSKEPEVEAPDIQQPAFRQTGPTAFGL